MTDFDPRGWRAAVKIDNIYFGRPMVGLGRRQMLHVTLALLLNWYVCAVFTCLLLPVLSQKLMLMAGGINLISYFSRIFDNLSKKESNIGVS